MDRLLGISKAGHDAGKIYVILAKTDNTYIMADGIYKTIQNPKKKNSKHIQIIREFTDEIAELISKDNVSDLEIKRAIKLYKSEERHN